MISQREALQTEVLAALAADFHKSKGNLTQEVRRVFFDGLELLEIQDCFLGRRSIRPAYGKEVMAARFNDLAEELGAQTRIIIDPNLSWFRWLTTRLGIARVPYVIRGPRR